MAFASYYPLNEKFVKEKGNKFGLESDTTLYNGPFVLTDWKHEQGWKLKKNEQYWDKKTVKLEEINYSVVKEPATRVNLYDTGAIDFALLSGEFVDKYRNNKRRIWRIFGNKYVLLTSKSKTWWARYTVKEQKTT